MLLLSCYTISTFLSAPPLFWRNEHITLWLVCVCSSEMCLKFCVNLTHRFQFGRLYYLFSAFSFRHPFAIHINFVWYFDIFSISPKFVVFTRSGFFFTNFICFCLSLTLVQHIICVGISFSVRWSMRNDYKNSKEKRCNCAYLSWFIALFRVINLTVNCIFFLFITDIIL